MMSVVTAILRFAPRIMAILSKYSSREYVRCIARSTRDDPDCTGKCTLVAAALSMIERSLLDQRPAFFVTAGRRGGGKTTTLTMLIMAVTGIWPAAAAWSTNEEERRKALLSYFLYGVTYILWDNIGRGSQISCPHIEKSCTSAYYSDRRLGVSEMVATAASVIHFFTGNNISPRGDLASRSLQVRLSVDRPDPENRTFAHPNPVGWTENNRAEILRSLYTILLGNPMLKKPFDEVGGTRFKMWYRLVGSAVEHAARLVKAEAADLVNREIADQETREKMDKLAAQPDVDFAKLFLVQETESDEDSASLADALAVMKRRWPKFKASDIAALINREGATSELTTEELEQMKRDRVILREYLYGHVPADFVATSKSVGDRLKAHRDEPAKSGDDTLILRGELNRDSTMVYTVVNNLDAE